MSGSGLVSFIVNLIALLASGAIFFLTIDKVAPDEFFAKIAKIAIGALLLIALVITIAAVFGLATGLTISPLGVIYFAVAVIVAIVVLYIINLVIDWIAGQIGGGAPWTAPVKYVLGAIVLIGLLIAAANFLFGYRVGGLDMRRGEPFRLEHRTIAALSGVAAGYLPRLLSSA